MWPISFYFRALQQNWEFEDRLQGLLTIKLPKIHFSPTGKPGSLRWEFGTLTSLGRARRRKATACPLWAHACTSGQRPMANVPLLCTHSSKQSFSFPSFETKQFPQKYGFRHKIGNSTKQTEMFCFKYWSHLFTLRNSLHSKPIIEKKHESSITRELYR